MTCPSCGTENTPGANRCDCGSSLPTYRAIPPKPSSVKPSHVVIAGFAVLGVMFIGLLRDLETSNRPPANRYRGSIAAPNAAPAPPPAIRTTPAEILADYESNEIAAEAKYKGHRVVVTGTIDSIGKDVLGTPYLTMKPEDGFWGVQCMFSGDAPFKLQSARKGDPAVIGGNVSGKLGNVLMKDCSIH